ncbi:L-asparaginase-like isoform X2 [Anticarsia gemmatalis]|uniref:L-asparaginase-like isoform X2 n=1 Tax=Anticarsia gemmatalis TaxID=129554 RepID=UPI003F7611E7
MEGPELSESSLDVLVPSLPGSPRSWIYNRNASQTSVEDVQTKKLKQAIDFLHHDDELLIAAELGDEEILQRLITRGVNIHVLDHLGRNAIHLAVCTGNRHAVLTLLNAGASPNVKDNVGMTPLSLCLMRSPSWRMANMLLDYGAEILPRSNQMDTGLFLQEERILRLLVEKGCLVNDPNAPGGRQALHFAAMSDNCHLIKILLNLGADLFAVNHRKETPREVAATFRCRNACRLLEEWEDFYNANNRTLTVMSL